MLSIITFVNFFNLCGVNTPKHRYRSVDTPKHNAAQRLQHFYELQAYFAPARIDVQDTNLYPEKINPFK